MHRLIKAGETTDARQTVYFDLRQPDGITPCTTEASGQPQVSTDGASWTNTGIGTLTHIGNGRYYAVLTDTITGIANVGKIILTRYYNASTTPETPGDSVELVAYDPALGANGVLAGQAQAGGNTTITLASGASATDNYYRGATVHLIGGTGADQIRTIVSYVGSTKVATIDFAWATNPDSTSNYRLSSTRSPAMDTSLRVALGTAGIDAIITEGSTNARQALALILDAVAGVLSGAAGTSITIKDPAGSNTRIAATVDADGNRSAVTLSPPA